MLIYTSKLKIVFLEFRLKLDSYKRLLLDKKK